MQPLEPVLFRAVRLAAGCAPSAGESVSELKRGDRGRDRDGQRELPIKLTGDAAHERRRHKHRAQHQRDGDDCAADFVHRLPRRVARAQAHRDVMLDVFHHHDGVIDHDADREHEAEKRKVVQRESEEPPSPRTCR